MRSLGKKRVNLYRRTPAGFGNLSVSRELRQPGDKNSDAPGRYRPVRRGNPSPTGRSLFGCGSKIELAPLVDDIPPSPNPKSLHESTTPTTRGRKPSSSRSTPPTWCGNPNPTGYITDWLGFVEPAPTGEDGLPSLDHISFHTSKLRQTRDDSPPPPRVHTAPHVGETPTPTGSITDCLRARLIEGKINEKKTK